MNQQNQSYDVIIIGGSYAGLSAAMALGRSLRKVLVIDGGEPCNAQTPHSHNFLTRDGSRPGELADIARRQVEAYDTVSFLSDLVEDVMLSEREVSVVTANNAGFRAKQLLLATGVKDEFPNINGFKECWGITVLHCPYCHGYEVRDRKLAVMVNGDQALEYVWLIRNISKNITVLTNGPHQFSEKSIQQLKSHNVPLLESKIAVIEHNAGQMQRITLENGETHDFEAAFARVAFTQSPLVTKLGCALTQSGHVQVDELGKTSVDFVYAAGDCTTQMRSVSAAVAGGTKAGAAINRALVEMEYVSVKM